MTVKLLLTHFVIRYDITHVFTLTRIFEKICYFAFPKEINSEGKIIYGAIPGIAGAILFSVFIIP